MIENVTATKAFDPDSRYGMSQAGNYPQPVESDEARLERVHQRLMEWWTQAREAQSINRYQQAIDSDFKDGLQWADEDAQALQERGQAPLVFNKIAPAINWILGTEKRTRIDFNVYPRKKDGNKEAEVKKELLKYISDANKSVFARSRAFDDAVTVGIGWLEDSIRGDDTKELLASRHESWRNIWYDHLGTDRDLSDSRYLFRSKFIDLDLAKAMFPNHAGALDSSSRQFSQFANEQQEDDDYFYALHYQQRDAHGNALQRRTYTNSGMIFNRRERVRLIECWFKEPISKQLLRGGQFHGEVYDPENANHLQAIEEGNSSIADSLVMQMFCAVMTESKLLQLQQSPYKHNQFPFTPVWGYRRGRDNAPYGVVRGMRDAQEDLNKRASKALHVLSTNQIIADDDAAKDWDDIRDEAARPDGIILLDGRRNARFEVNNDKQLAEEHLKLMEMDAKMIQDISGVTDENLGRDTNAKSGKAITARQEQGSIVTAELFDNLRYAIQLQGEKQLSLVEQFYNQEKIVRVTGDKGNVDFIHLNTPVWDEQSGQFVYENDITATQADFVVDEQDYQASMRDAMFQTMNELMRTLPPEVALQLLDLVYENSDLPGRDEIVTRIRQINGQVDPANADDPQQQAQAAQKAQQDAINQQQAQKKIQLELDLMQANIDKIRASMTETNMKSVYEGLQSAQVAASMPQMSSIADSLLKSAGFEDKNGEPLAVPVQQKQIAQIPQEQSPADGYQQGIETMRNDGERKY